MDLALLASSAPSRDRTTRATSNKVGLIANRHILKLEVYKLSVGL